MSHRRRRYLRLPALREDVASRDSIDTRVEILLRLDELDPRRRLLVALLTRDDHDVLLVVYRRRKHVGTDLYR